MSKLRRIANLLLSLLMIAGGVVLMLDPENGLPLVALVLGLALMIYGIHKLVYYITMARHMVGGLLLLFISVIAIDISVFALTQIEDPRLSIVLYLVCYNAFTGVLAIARAVESKIFKSRWLPSFIHGVINVVLAVLCLVFVGSDQIVIAIFCFGLFYNAFARLVSAFKPTEVIYIQ